MFGAVDKGNPRSSNVMWTVKWPLANRKKSGTFCSVQFVTEEEVR